MVNSSENVELLELFPIPVLKRRVPEYASLNATLKALILQRADSEKGLSVSNVNGWHSARNLLEGNAECIKELKQQFLEAAHLYFSRMGIDLSPADLSSLEIEAWANVNYTNSSNAIHDHLKNGTQWSAIYYVDGARSGSGTTGGETIFVDREHRFVYKDQAIARVASCKRGNYTQYQPEVSITPENGMFVLFPSSTWHRVNPYQGSEARITIAFNFKSPLFHYVHENEASLKSWFWLNFRGPMSWVFFIKRQIKTLLQKTKK